ncbi:Membrane protein PTM1 [Cladophialophora carrionii]|uniref:Membrane protein PTM1 n=1 Tax=Cladophialophora carrionii TaxID=86049 RepID=A0A1C1C990_9EURO|nr:Membrane protein PTM1 [Cladophialophora carrionii]
MQRWVPSLGLLAYLAALVAGNEMQIKQDDEHRQRCAGMYSRKSWGGSIEPFILVKFLPDHTEDDSDPLASLVIFEWQDEPLIGRMPPGAESYRDLETICTTGSVSEGLCEEKDIGAFILAPNATDASKSPIYNEAIHLKDPKAVNYPIRRTGYYCVSTYAFSDHEYNGVVEFRNAYGELPAAQIAKLPFYGGLTIVYAVLGVFWAFLYFQNRSDILPVQNYITAIIIFLIVEQLMTWGFYDYQNRHGNNTLNKVFMIIVSILNAGRNSFSFFLLLIVCMGYGVVKPSLGKTMIYVRILAAAHFVFGVIYAIASMAVTPESVGPLILFVILPLAGTMTAFYVWTLSSLNITIKDLIDRKQKTKAMMYKKLSWCILGSVLVIFAFFFINSFAFAGSSAANFVPDHWQTRWFVLDGWLNLVYLFNIAFIAYLWRPTANNRRFAMSDELAQDDDGFEIRSIADSLDDEDEEAARKDQERAVPPTGGASTTVMDSLAQEPPPARKPSPAPALQNSSQAPPPIRAPPQSRMSLDGETIFAVGDEGGEWSDGEDSDDERKKLTSK